MKATVYKMTIMVIDFENMGEDGIKQVIEGCKYACPDVLQSESRDVEWIDEHPLNNSTKSREAFYALFAAPQPQEQS
jgi:hypothetical protein